jgi:large subunit ribosomal protein L6
MSRIGRKSIALPKGVTVTEQDQMLRVSGPKGALSLPLSDYVSVRQEAGALIVDRKSDDRQARAHHGLMRNLVANLVTGVTTGFEKRLDIVGVGFKAEVGGGKLNLTLGYSHPVIFDIPKGIDISVEKATKLIVRGMDAQQVGQVAAVIRNYRLPDPYKAKGIRYENEVIKVKAGKTGSK